MSSTLDKIDISHDALQECFFCTEYRLGTSAGEAAAKINRTMGQDTVSHMTAAKLFNRFHKGDLHLEDEPCSGGPASIGIDAIRAAVEEDPRQTARCLAQQFQCSKQFQGIDHTDPLRSRQVVEAWIMGTA